MQIFFALASVLGVMVTSKDATNAFANSAEPTVPTYVRIDDQYAEWYKERFGVDLDRTLVMPVQHVLQDHPEYGALWEKQINVILMELGFCNTTQNIYVATICSKLVLVFASSLLLCQSLS